MAALVGDHRLGYRAGSLPLRLGRLLLLGGSQRSAETKSAETKSADLARILSRYEKQPPLAEMSDLTGLIHAAEVFTDLRDRVEALRAPRLLDAP